MKEFYHNKAISVELEKQDIIGDGELSIVNDAELPNVIYNTFKKLGFDKFTICINNRKLLNGLLMSTILKSTNSNRETKVVSWFTILTIVSILFPSPLHEAKVLV